MTGQGIVIGGGIGGLLAARVLAARFEGVTVLERYSYPGDPASPAPASRRGAPQSRCLHLLMAGGAAAFDELVPGWREALVALGAVPIDASADAAMHFPAGWLPRTPSGIITYACSRSLLERVLRRALDEQANVQVLEGQQVVALLGTGRRVTGVRTAAVDGSGETDVAADLVVDASGRGSRLLEWLSAVPDRAASLVDETVVDSGTQYVSRWFELAPHDAPDWHCLSVAPTSCDHRAAMMLRAEHDCWGVVLLAPAGYPLPADDKAFLEFTEGLGEGRLRAALERAKPLAPIQHYGIAGNRLRHYDRVPDWPAGLVALGDSACALDPYFGLGMTVAARGAVLLRDFLDRDVSSDVAGAEFQKRLAALHIQPWRLATGCDAHGNPALRNDDCLARFCEAAPTSSEIAHALLAVQHLLRPIESLTDVCAQ